MKLLDLFKLLRPKHWVKNALIAAPFLFAFTFTTASVVKLLVVVAGFCLLSSAVYVVNDIADRDSDRHHPKKRLRPIAAGKVSVSAAIVLAVILAVSGFSLVATVNEKVLAVSGIYAAMNLAYSFYLKHVPILDVMIIAFGFLIRVVAGAYAVHVPLSHWILLCTFFGALFLAFGKRKNEMALPQDDKRKHRQSASEYTDRFIDQMLALTAGISVAFYAFYTIDPATVGRFGSQRLIYTTPIVVYGVFRYYYMLYNRNEGGDPVNLVLKDLPLILCMGLWLVSIGLIYLYGNHKIFV